MAKVDWESMVAGAETSMQIGDYQAVIAKCMLMFAKALARELTKEDAEHEAFVGEKPAAGEAAGASATPRFEPAPGGWAIPNCCRKHFIPYHPPYVGGKES